ncbi:aminotransferase class V-fold PLP-dependent enzyme [Pseudomonas sp. RIT-PI-S]|uniref:pyoverdine-tailoring periplasmic protein PvdN n=1 Tax=Pseudomonas sp. RIT-PI-S TaxID=3035295 RepID=UPI0021DB214B|nr:aminotransferase class V-fold PLP-dependent enzyme [Pseudomonas sp. RIT-PI-S]
MTDRRSFLKHAGLLAAAPWFGAGAGASAAAGLTPPAPGDWQALRAQFDLDPRYLHMTLFLLASHPRPVQQAIDQLRQRFNRNPAEAVDWHREEIWQYEDQVRARAGAYFGVTPGQVALTGSTSDGLAAIYGGLVVPAEKEILTSAHEHYATYTRLAYRQRLMGTRLREVPLFRSAAQASVDEIVGNLKAALRPDTRVLGLTWVHSGSGVKLPMQEIAALVRDTNRDRDEADRLIYVVDGVHGFGVENANFADFGCDYFIAGTHKWLFGPRGTGVIIGAQGQMPDHLVPTVPTFSRDDSFGTTMTPGGYHAFEHRLALGSAFDLHLALGKAQVQARIHQLNADLKARLAQYPKVELVTPRAAALSSGFTFFRVRGRGCDAVADHLLAQRVLADAVERDAGPVVRLAPGLLNDETELDVLMRRLAPMLT